MRLHFLFLAFLLLSLAQFAVPSPEPPVLPPQDYDFPVFPEYYEKPWESPQFESGNPWIIQLPGASIYSGKFDSDLTSLSLLEMNLNPQAHYYPKSEIPIPEKDLPQFLSRIGSANSELESAKRDYATAHTLYLSAKEAKNANPLLLAFLLPGASQLNLIPLSILAAQLKLSAVYDYATKFPPAYKSSLTHYISSLEHSGAAVNLALLSLKEEVSSLEFAGAGQPSYLGPSKEKYLALKNSLASPDAKLPALSSLSQELSQELSSGTSPPAHSPALLLGLAGTRDSLLDSLLSNAKTAKKAREEMEQEANSGIENCQAQSTSFSLSLSQAEPHELYRIDSRSLSLLSEKTLSQSDFAGTISDKFSDLQNSQEKLKSLHSLSQSYLSSKNRNHLSNSISSSRECQSLSSSSQSTLSQILSDSQSIVSSLREKAASQIDSTDSSLSSFPPQDSASSLKKARAESLLSQALENFTNADASQKLGQKFDYLFSALSLSQAAQAELSGKYEEGSYLPSLELSRLLSEYRLAISNAKKDGLQVSSHELLLSEYSQLLSSGTLDFQQISALSSDIDSQLSQISLLEKEKFSPVLSKREEALSLSPYFSSLDPSHASLLETLESKYFSGLGFRVSGSGPLSPQISKSAFGHFSEIDSSYSEILSSFQKLSPQALSQILSENSFFSETSQSEPCLDEPYAQEIFISVQNPTLLSSSLPVQAHLKIPQEISLKDAKETPPELSDLAYSPSKSEAVLSFSRISPQSSYSLSFSKNSAPASTEEIQKEAQASPQEAIIRKEVSFQSPSSLPSLCAKIPIPQDAYSPHSESGWKTLQVVRYPTYAKVLLKDLQKGPNSFSLSYSLPSPYSISKTQISAKEEAGDIKVSYRLEISNAKEEFTSLKISVQDYANESVSGFSLIPLSLHQISKTKSELTQNGLEYSFEISRLSPGEKALFSASYVSGNSRSYAQSLFSSLNPKTFQSNKQALSLYSEAQALLNTHDYPSAIKKLLSLQSLLLQEGSAREYAKEEYLLRENQTSSLLEDSSRAWSYLSNSSLLEEKYSGQDLTAKSLLEEAQKQFSLGNTGRALSLLSDANSKLSEHSPQSLLLQAHLNLSKELLHLKDSASSLSLSREERTNLDSLLSQISSSLLQARTAALSGNLQESASLLDSANLQIREAKSELSRLSSSNLSPLLQDFSSYESEKTSFLSLLQSYSLHYSRSKESKIHFSFPKTPKQIQDDFESLDKQIQKISQKFLPCIANLETQNPKPETPTISNAPPCPPTQSEISSLKSALSSFSLLKNSTSQALSLLEKSARSSHELAEKSIERLSQESPPDPQAQKKISDLAARVSESSRALSQSDWPLSLSFTQGIPKEASLLLASIPPSQGEQPEILFLSLGAFLVLALAVGILFLLRKKEKKQKRKLKVPSLESRVPGKQKPRLKTGDSRPKTSEWPFSHGLLPHSEERGEK